MASGNGDSLKSVLRDLGENTSVHGIPKILTSKNKLLKIFWLIVFLGTFGYLCFQMHALFTDYYSYPIETTVSLKFSAIQFPAVTFCNMNPMKKSMLKIAPDSLQNSLKQQQAQSSTEGENTEEDDDYEYNYDYNYDNSEYQEEIDNYFSDPSPLQEEYLRLQNPIGPKSKWQDRIDKFKTEYKKLVNSDIDNFGHQLSDMLVSCAFNKRRCNSSYFHHSINLDYGNCYTITSENFVARKAGQVYGLHLILNLEVSEYITSLSSAYGIKLVMHQPRTKSYPSVEGLALSSGQETTMALRTVEVHRLGGNYGICKDSLLQDTGRMYTQPSCLNFCVQQHVIRQCKCLPGTLEDDFSKPEYKDLYYCEDEDFEKMVCQFGIEKRQLEGTLNCDCPSPCHEILYTKTLSSRSWPHDEYLRQFLMVKVCAKNLTSAAQACAEYKENAKNFSVESVIDNFLAVNIYFEDVNYEVITESAKYDEFQLLSNIGGTLGLFVGASVLSFVEIIQMLLEVVAYICKSRSKKNEVQELKADEKA